MDPEKGGPNPEEVRPEDPLVAQVGSKLHDAWRETRRVEGSDQFEPRLKSTKDEAWIAAHGGKNEVDIANTSYEDLPEDWKAENKAAAEAAVSEIRAAEKSGKALDDAFIDTASEAQHVAWLSRNGSWAPAEQKLPFAQLSEPEKEKDRVVVRTALNVYRATQAPSAPSTNTPGK